jgi:hypothetical protein
LDLLEIIINKQVMICLFITARDVAGKPNISSQQFGKQKVYVRNAPQPTAVAKPTKKNNLKPGLTTILTSCKIKSSQKPNTLNTENTNVFC